jgi:hypothetical protein
MGLFIRGFFPDEQGMFCSGGEVIVETEEGIIYVLNFGNIADKTFEQKEAERRKAEQQANGAAKPDEKAEPSKARKEGAGRKGE